MWWLKSESAALAQRWRSRLRPPQSLWWGPAGLWHVDGDSAAGAAQRHDSFESWCRLHRGSRARLWLSSWWVLDLVINPALPLEDDAALLDHARPLLRHFMGEVAEHWPLAAWHSGARKGVSALHGQPLQALQQVARAHQVHLQQVQPWWARALALAARQQPLLSQATQARLLVVEGTLLTDLWLQHGAVQGLQQRRLAEPDGDSLSQYLVDSPLGAGVPPHPAAGAPAPARTWALGYGHRPPKALPPLTWQPLAPMADPGPAAHWWHTALPMPHPGLDHPAAGASPRPIATARAAGAVAAS